MATNELNNKDSYAPSATNEFPNKHRVQCNEVHVGNITELSPKLHVTM